MTITRSVITALAIGALALQVRLILLFGDRQARPEVRLGSLSRQAMASSGSGSLTVPAPWILAVAFDLPSPTGKRVSLVALLARGNSVQWNRTTTAGHGRLGGVTIHLRSEREIVELEAIAIAPVAALIHPDSYHRAETTGR